MTTSLKAGFAQIFSCCPKNELPKIWRGGGGGGGGGGAWVGAAAPLATTSRTPMNRNNGKIKESFFLILTAYIHDSEQKKIENL